VALGVAVVQPRFENPREILGDRLREGSLYRLLADHGDRLFPDEYFADLYKVSSRGRPTVPARVLATVIVLQAFEGLSDREAPERLEVDLRWQAAAGVDAGAEAFDSTVLVGQRNRLRASTRPRRLFEDTTVVARQAGVLKGRVRVLDSVVGRGGNSGHGDAVAGGDPQAVDGARHRGGAAGGTGARRADRR
jgi:Transposase domain (DUF772)